MTEGGGIRSRSDCIRARIPSPASKELRPRRQWNSGRECLLHDLEGCAPANEKYARSQRKFAIKKSPANNFIDSVMATDIFSNQEWFAVETKNASRVNSASAGEVALVPTQERWKREQCFELNADAWGRLNRRGILPDHGGTLFPPDTAG